MSIDLKTVKHISKLSSQLDVNVSKKVKNIDQNSAAFILQGVLDYLNK